MRTRSTIDSATVSVCLLEVLESRKMLSTTPNDPRYTQQTDLAAVAASDAWDVVTGGSTTVIANNDTGIDYTHQDLYKNVWINQAEIPGSIKTKLKDTDKDGVISFYDLNSSKNSKWVNDVNANGYIDAGDLLSTRNADGSGGWENGGDNGSNGYVDDIIGWDFAGNDNDPMDYDGHGTHTSGTIAAIGNNATGITGMMWKASLMAVKIFTDDGSGASETAIAEAIRYSTDNGAVISNNSWGGSYASTAIYNAIAYAGTKGQTFVVAAGNEGVNNDISPRRSYPASFDLPNVITVAASSNSGTLSYYSNYGATTVDIAAPGDNILSTLPNGQYGYQTGTSMATPHVTGAIALMLTVDKTLTSAQVKAQLLAGADDTTSLSSRVASGGMLDVNNAVRNEPGLEAPVTSQPGTGRRVVYLPPWLFDTATNMNGGRGALFGQVGIA